MKYLHFEEGQLIRELEKIPPKFRTVFAAACAERLLPAYVTFSKVTGRGNAKELSDLLSWLWNNLDGNFPLDVDVQAKVDLCMSLIPRADEEPWVDEQAAAEDAGAATAYALRCLQNGQSQEAAWAARRVYEAIDHYVITLENVDTNSIGAEQRLLEDPLVQAELMRQRRDLQELVCLAHSEKVVPVAQFRKRASDEGMALFESKETSP